ncbi:MAG TPA: electron transport complex subunit RsxD [Pseudoalteromonas prydzensis]|uniref:Ion-translocating oxidoreductase complex subunit D n=1 Tax=Pseudoalteromonas prydzensis TaxID=182141 RepID=A0A7V1CX32_9GAMM|nr:electron transport complex subunit RsxD [Pseudoalteromonas prydzensis]HEA15933.1 electron transport complex subunit RsxD [Pseudoalteromonas prydzensis]
MKLTMASSPHSHSHKSLSRLMQTVILACIPGLIAQLYFFGTGVIIQLVLALLTASISEAIIMLIRKRPVWPALSDGSAWLTAVLLALSIPPLAPWWVIVIGSFFAIVIVKQLYGGLGFNLFNPAMAAYVLLLISFPVQMTTWMPVSDLLANPISFSQQLSVVFNGFTSGGFSVDQLRVGVDGVTMATPLDTIKTDIAHGLTVTESMQAAIFNSWLGQGWGWINLGFLLGGLYLLKAKVINWHIPVGVLASIAVCSAIGYIAAPGTEPGVVFHLFSGATMLGAFFIATDPVSAATTNRGRLIYGALIGLLVYLIRTFGGYPDAMAFAVLLLNMAVPLIDYYTQPRTYGHGVNK